MKDEPTPRWKIALASAVAIVVIGAVVIWRDRIGADFWPLDSSRVAPNLLAGLIQWAIIFLVAVLIWPPWRRRIHRFVDAKLAPLHASHEELHRKLDRLHESHRELHEKLDALEKKP